jgi:inorganic pyrophosphatase
VKTLKEMNPELLKELEEFFINYNKSEGVKFRLLACRGPKTAVALVKKGATK